MNTKLIALLFATAPTAVFAHEGHGGMGLFHHLYELAPAITLVAIVAFVIYQKTK
ncbi:hypothetical protein Q4601_12945 [Shewanella sp. 1_MG-2023]|uniref:Uncharacterized protein n=1 Tax=Shewanella electrodiphila TaxID=934143 RepID=A0ABT0KTC9_9GAMM|nr:MULTISPECIES: hypothetical protein [Shewanella]MCL1046811.1 hypothetical protein [Shewanella electrodiphila]MDO6612888.1 hypothetical protein [Shewanella sp. 7_MG-2023]MDO6772582.1 hypothetical protein [Shewanella sp. 2_MG-2023]MDO6795214.1 hypothetical protein [Shewanella sp. 1_MG-2023]